MTGFFASLTIRALIDQSCVIPVPPMRVSVLVSSRMASVQSAARAATIGELESTTCTALITRA
jgi:hypothetical protein